MKNTKLKNKSKPKSKANCKAKNQKEKCVVYERKHANPMAAKNHTKGIKNRGGKVSSKKVGSSIVLTYSFPKKKK